MVKHSPQILASEEKATTTTIHRTCDAVLPQVPFNHHKGKPGDANEIFTAGWPDQQLEGFLLMVEARHDKITELFYELASLLLRGMKCQKCTPGDLDEIFTAEWPSVLQLKRFFHCLAPCITQLRICSMSKQNSSKRWCGTKDKWTALQCGGLKVLML